MLVRTALFAAVSGSAIALPAQKSYTYTSVPGDPIETRIYTLDNGLQVWLSRNNDAPRVQTQIAVRAGSKNDPADATGLAHYLEHMLFKGTSAIGTANWTAESALLKQISDLYELRRNTTDEAERGRIYVRIDSLSQLASKLAIPNEYDKMVSSMGARGTNAFTSTERTVYVNDVPSTELEKWMMIESVRFQECVLRLFHTELETVFEEFNRGQDNDQRNSGQALNRLLYEKHPYGTQTTIGTGEHLKNPSMEKIQAYFHTYYVPNNMAVILAGDLNYDATVAMVDKYFGGWKMSKLTPYTAPKEEPIVSFRTAEVLGPMAEWVTMAWRFGGYASEDPVMLRLISGMLSNGRAGLIDLNLMQKQKVLSAGAFAGIQTDYSELLMRAEPRQGQSLEEARDLLIEQLALLGRGEFDDWLIPAVVNNYRQQQVRAWTDNNNARVSSMQDAFILRKDWKDVIDLNDRMAKITKPQVMEYVKRHFRDNYAIVFKRTGENTSAFKVAKPPITPIDINREGMSDWRKEWEAVPSAWPEPVFLDYKTALTERTLSSGVKLSQVKNKTNELFSLTYIVDMGTNHDRALGLAVRYLPYLGTGEMSAEDFKKEFFKLGLQMNVSTSNDRVQVSLSGLDENMARGVELLEHLLAGAKPNELALKELVNDIVKERNDALKNKSTILNVAMFNFARYGKRSPFTNVLSEEEMKSIDPTTLTDRIHAITSYPHAVFHYGRSSADEVVKILETTHRSPTQWLAIPAALEFPELETTSNSVYFVEHDMVQAELLMVSKAGAFDKQLLPLAALFNEYFGSGLSSIVFQEIREAKALAYSAFAFYSTPSEKDEAHYVRAFIGTQSDKLGDAVDAMMTLMNDMPLDGPQFEGARTAALKQIGSDRITRERIFWSIDQARRLGMDTDIRKENYEQLKKLAPADLKAFFEQQVKGRNYGFLVIGKKSRLNMEALARMGTVTELSKAEIFGYDAVP